MPRPLSRRLSEATDALWDALVDPCEPYDDTEDTWWLPLGSDGETAARNGGPFDEAQLRAVRNQCRLLALTNEFAINGHENRISYIVGPGHSYRAVPRRGCAPAAELLAAAQRELDLFLSENRWRQRQQETVRRCDRDGECFLRFFTSSAGVLQVRFVEPGQIVTPPRHAARPEARCGILTAVEDVEDVEDVHGYFVDGELIDAAEIQHRKAQVDANVRRGIPLFYPVRKNLRRAEKLLRNMSAVAEIQSAIALIRKHRHATRSGLEAFVSGTADAISYPNGDNGGPNNPARPRYTKRYAPGTILDASGTVDYEFPAAQLNAGNYVTVLQAELRAIASRLVMPEFMLTSDASNANYSSTMVAEGPALRMFARLQAEQVADDREVVERALRVAAHSGRLPREALELCEVQATPPSLATRDPLLETRRRQIEHASGILSPQTWSQQLGLDYDQEQTHFAAHRSALHSPERGTSVPR